MPSSYFPLDVNFFDHPKVIERSDPAVRLCLAAIGYANRFQTDGYVAPPIPGRLISVPWDSDDRPETYAAELVRAVLWHKASDPCPRGHVKDCPEIPGADGWRIHDFLEHNRSKDERQEVQRAERDRKAAWRERQRKARDVPPDGDAGVPRDITPPGDAGRTRRSDAPGTPNTYTETDTEGSVLRTGRVATAPATITPIPTAQTFVAAYVDAYRGRAGHDPPPTVKGQLAKHLGQAFTAGIPPDTIKAAFVEWFDADQHPATLPSFIEVKGRGGKPRRRTRQQEQRDQLIETSTYMQRWATERMRERGDNGERAGMGNADNPPQPQLPRPGTTP